MAEFNSDGIAIHYEDEGAGEPVILVHGFGANARGNWRDPGWIDLLAPSYRVVAPDCRGHGLSGKPYDSAAYSIEKMAGDVINLIDHLEIRRARLMGYSMGGRISMELLTAHPERWRAVVLGGVGAGRSGIAEAGRRESIIKGLLADDPKSVIEPTAKQFRRFAEANHNDLKALAACMAGHQMTVNWDRFGTIRTPVMIVVGTDDTLVSGAESVAKAIAGAELILLSGRDHLSAVGDKRYKEAVLRFFASAPA